jgi:MoxR-like ATPase
VSDEQNFEPRIEIAKLQEKIRTIKKEIGTVLIGQEKVVDLMIAALLSKGHILIEGVPGIAKTLAAKLLAGCTSSHFARIQFTPDLMPSDVLGTSVFNLKNSEFVFNKGPIFANLILIDEINRAPAKTQSALFEVMEEKQVTIDGQTYKMEEPFIVMATQNPIEHEGTYKLPEAQLDRFLFKIEAEYPTHEEEVAILERFNQNNLESALQKIKPVLSNRELTDLQRIASQVHAEQKLLQYIARIIEETRQNNAFYLGGSPRAGLAILNGAKSWAAMQGKDFITPDDIKFIAQPALNHRLLLTAEKEMEGVKVDQILDRILEKIEVPR